MIPPFFNPQTAPAHISSHDLLMVSVCDHLISSCTIDSSTSSTRTIRRHQSVCLPSGWFWPWRADSAARTLIGRRATPRGPRLRKNTTKNRWSSSRPHSTALWLSLRPIATHADSTRPLAFGNGIVFSPLSAPGRLPKRADMASCFGRLQLHFTNAPHSGPSDWWRHAQTTPVSWASTHAFEATAEG